MLDKYNSLAALYAQLRLVMVQQVSEREELYTMHFPWSERHLHCVWYDERFRPPFFKLAGGEQLKVLEPGEWNLESGPDFLNATLLIEPGARYLRGDIELHIRPSEWETHGHSQNPAYANVIAHVTWFSAPQPASLDQSVLRISLAETLSTWSERSLADIDLKAYPFAILPVAARPCAALIDGNPDTATALLSGAGFFRLQLKTQRIKQRLLQGEERHQVFFEEFMGALGYKHNQRQFRTLAQFIPLDTLTDSRESAFARLLGTAGLLPEPGAAGDPPAAELIRKLWDTWWKQTNLAPSPKIEWHFASLRPQNHPVRRLAAAASLFGGIRDVLTDIDQINATSMAEWQKTIARIFMERCDWQFWNQRLSFGSEVAENQRTVLLGRARIAAILTNVVIPFLVAEEQLLPDCFTQLSAEDTSSPMRLTANRLLGRDHNPALYNNSGLLQQGLLQIYQDFCLSAKPGCEGCQLCDRLVAFINDLA